MRHFEFTAETEARFERMLDRLCSNDGGMILRNSLRLYEWAIGEVEAGKVIASIDKAGNSVVMEPTPMISK